MNAVSQSENKGFSSWPLKEVTCQYCGVFLTRQGIPRVRRDCPGGRCPKCGIWTPRVRVVGVTL